MHTTKLVILGRDGTLNEYREGHVTEPAEWQPLPGALEAVARLNHAGWHVVVATNQAGIGRGMIDMAAVNAVHTHMNQLLAAVPMAADTLRDLLAAHAAGCEPHLLLTGRAANIGDDQLHHMLSQVPGARAHADLAAFADFLLRRDHVADSASGELG